MPRLGHSAALLLGALAVTLCPTAAVAQDTCRHAVILTLPGVTWGDVRAAGPSEILDAARAGALGSISVRTNTARTSYAAGFGSIGAGARVDGARSAGGPAAASDPVALEASPPLVSGMVAAGLAEMKDLARRAGYRAAPGALGSALDDIPLIAVGNGDRGMPPPLPAGFGRWTLLGAMDRAGRVALSATGGKLLRAAADAPYGVRTDPTRMRRAVEEALAVPCSVVMIEQGDVARADTAALASTERAARVDMTTALLAASDVLERARALLDPDRDLLMIVSPTSPAAADQARLGVAIAVGPGFEPGTVLESSTTRRRGLVTLPDVAPTVLDRLGVAMPAAMNGGPWLATEAASDDRIQDALDLNSESVFVDDLKSNVATAFVVFQVLVYLVAIPLVARSEARPERAPPVHWLEPAALAVVAFPVSTYLAGIARAHELGAGGFVALLVLVDAGLVALVTMILRRPLERLLALTALTTTVLVADLATAGALQLNTVFGYSPIVAGRFAGAGNIAFAVLGASGLITGALIVHHRRHARQALLATALLFAAVVVVDGAPQLGSDVGGTLALVPALGVTWLLLAGRRPSPRIVVLSVVAGVVVLGAFLALDLARPPDDRTHLARLFIDVRARGLPVLVDTIDRKATANIRVFRSTVYTLFVPPALGVMAWLLRRPRGRWERLARAYPRLRAGLIGGLVLAVLGFAVNDSGIVVPAVILSYLVPMALLVHLALDRDASP
ncbi:MAG: hypothetical protein ABR529_04500 [Actinomycetota bacterium]